MYVLANFYIWFFTTGFSAPTPAHSVRALHPLSLPVLRQRLLHDDRPLCLQHSLPAHEREGEIRLMQRNNGGRGKNDYKFEHVVWRVEIECLWWLESSHRDLDCSPVLKIQFLFTCWSDPFFLFCFFFFLLWPFICSEVSQCLNKVALH